MVQVLRYEFNPGDRVSVHLSEDHTLSGELLPHPATFEAYHIADRSWCTVRLDEPHAGGSEARPPEILDVPVIAVRPAEDSSAT
jgi:hypothetical protein